jgi:hypothetical protein
VPRALGDHLSDACVRPYGGQVLNPHLSIPAASAVSPALPLLSARISEVVQQPSADCRVQRDRQTRPKRCVHRNKSRSLSPLYIGGDSDVGDHSDNNKDDPLGIYPPGARFRPPSPPSDISPLALEVARRFGTLPVAQQVNSIIQIGRKDRDQQRRAQANGWYPSQPVHLKRCKPLPLQLPSAQPAPRIRHLLPPRPTLIEHLGPPPNNSVTYTPVSRPEHSFAHNDETDRRARLRSAYDAARRRLQPLFSQSALVHAQPPDVQQRLNQLADQFDRISKSIKDISAGPNTRYVRVLQGFSLIGTIDLKNFWQNIGRICRDIAEVAEYNYFK